MTFNNNKRSYKKFLDSGEIADVPSDTLRRTKKKWIQRKSAAQNINPTCLKDEYQEQANESIISNDLPNTVTNMIFYVDNEGDDNGKFPDLVRSTHNDATEWEIPIDDYTNNVSCNETENNADKQLELLKENNLQDFIKNEYLFQTISTPVDKSSGEIMLLLLKFALRQKLPLLSISDLFRLANCFFKQPILPETSYKLDKLLNPKTNIEFHGICSNCEKYVGKIDTFKKFTECDICKFKINLSNPSLENIFLIIDPSEEVVNVINHNSSHYNYIVKHRQYDGIIKDVYDGACYRSFVNSLPKSSRTSYVTAILNTDGAPTFECSKYSIWPIYIIVNEIPVEARLKSSIVCGIWFGKKKPPMNTLLEPLVSKFNNLSSVGMECQIGNETRFLTLHVLIICVDSVARAPMQGHKQFNGKYGCSWCFHPGEWYEGSMRYPITDNYPEKRTAKQSVQFMQIVTENDNVQDCYGVKDVSSLINLKGFDIINGYVPDYMHCYLAGVGKQITESILQTFSVEVSLVDKILKSICVPQQLARFSKPISERSDWKAKEWENFILHYSLPLFRYLLPDDVVEYWSLLIESLHILLKDNITIEELNNADAMLHKFNIKTEEYFTKKSMTFNIHQLLHITESVFNWGPLFCHSTFPFESANHNLLQMIHCAKGVNLQIVRYLNYQKCLTVLEDNIYPHASPRIIQFCQDISKRNIQKSCKINEVTYLGNTSIMNPQILNNFHLSKRSTIYTRAVIHGCLYAAEKKNQRSNNSFCQLIDGTFNKIFYFVVDDENNKEVILCKSLLRVNKISNSIYTFEEISNEMIMINVKNIKTICVLVSIHNVNYISVVPNLYHY